MTSIIGSVAERKGRPLLAIGGLLLCWIAARAVLFELPPGLLPQPIQAVRAIIGMERSAPPLDHGALASRFSLPGYHALARKSLEPTGITLRADPVLPAAPPRLLQQLPVSPPEPLYRVVGHNLLWMAAMSGVPMPRDIAAAMRNSDPEASGPRASSAVADTARSRWSGDAWLTWRSGTGGLVGSGPAVPVYGASQTGAVLRYQLAPGSPIRPTAYVRSVRALETREGDVAAGLSIRPIESAPVTVQAEARLSRRGSRLALRPAIFASGGVDAAPLVGGLTARGYAQAGYVGGSDATAFADGSLIAEKSLWTGSRGSALTFGTGAWGGAQRDTARLDLGPTASFRVRLGAGSARLSADYRFRVAGNAEPASGAALTLSAGF